MKFEMARYHDGTTSRRRSDRREVSIEAELTHDSTTFSCNVHNLSSGGSKFEIAQILERDDYVELKVGDEKSLRGRVAWAQTPYYGLHFDDEGNEWSETLAKIEAYKAEDNKPAADDEYPKDSNDFDPFDFDQPDE